MWSLGCKIIRYVVSGCLESLHSITSGIRSTTRAQYPLGIPLYRPLTPFSLATELTLASSDIGFTEGRGLLKITSRQEAGSDLKALIGALEASALVKM